MNYTLSELRKKEVIDVINGDRLGFPCDVVIDACGNVRCVQLSRGGFHLFGGNDPKEIPWKHIERITEETIWVKSRL